MTRIRNADEFLLRFRRISDDYKIIFTPTIRKIRESYDDKKVSSSIDSRLEFHARVYFVNAFLASLNWNLVAKPEENLPNIFPEVPLRSERKGSIRFLDYLGIERETDYPLLVVETKRPSASLPQALGSSATYPEIISKGLSGESLMGEWNEWLNDDISDYVRSTYAHTKQVPRCVIITNGDWLILFLDPSNAFIESGIPDPSRILVFNNRKDIETRFSEIFLHLEYQQVLGKTPPLALGNFLFYINPDAVDHVMHGLRLKYFEQPRIYEKPAPNITVAPVLFLCSNYGAWLIVESPPRDYELPHKNQKLVQHLAEVKQAANKLLYEVNRKLGRSLHPCAISLHYDDIEKFEALQSVLEYERDEYFLVTGDNTHYLLIEPSAIKCPYHNWEICNRKGVSANSSPILARSTSPRSFFMSGELHHCAHRDVGVAKANPVTMGNRDRCGSRSGREGQAFCEIWRFEQHLCCRICAFEKVCTRATIFRLPCSPSNPIILSIWRIAHRVKYILMKLIQGK